MTPYKWLESVRPGLCLAEPRKEVYTPAPSINVCAQLHRRSSRDPAPLPIGVLPKCQIGSYCYIHNVRAVLQRTHEKAAQAIGLFLRKTCYGLPLISESDYCRT